MTMKQQQKQTDTMTNKINYKGVTLFISNKGQIYDKDGVELKQRTMKNYKTGYENPYLYVSIYCGKKSRLVQVSRLVCQAFHPIEHPERYQCDHRDNNPKNNVPSNLRWVSRKFNNSRKHTRMMKSLNYKCTRHNDEFLRAENLATGEVRFFKNGISAAQYIGCSHVLVYNAVRGLSVSHAKGWKVEWVNRNSPEAQEFANDIALKQMTKELLEAREKEERRIERRELKRKLKEQAQELKKKQKELARLEMEKLKMEQERSVWDKHAVIQLTQDGQFVREYKSVAEAVRETGLFTIRNCVKGVQDMAGGFVWRYKEEK